MVKRPDYYPEQLEKRVQRRWERERVFEVRNVPTAGRQRKIYVLDMFPYPSSEGLHVGHVEGYTASDVVARYWRLRGKQVLHPMGWDAFGLPAENYALRTGVHPRISTARNIARFRRQIKRLGLSYDWSREFSTTDDDYVRWTQWMFLKLYELGLAYQAEVPINWCPSCRTGLANEEVIGGSCERCGTAVRPKRLRQWMLRITKYANRLLKGLDKLDWPEHIKELQRNWIGRSEGAEVKFELLPQKIPLPVFTTRPDTLWGATYVVLAPEHELVQKWCTQPRSPLRNRAEVKRYVAAAARKTERERVAAEREKTGVLLRGVQARNPVNGEKIPVWVADYVLAGYGTGAIMAVPAHDERDFAFAQRYALPIKVVVLPPNFSSPPRQLRAAYEGEGKLVHAGKFSGLPSARARQEIVRWLQQRKQGKPAVQYKLRDWVFSRQRYWGEPIPLVHCKRCGVVPVPYKDLPVRLPRVKHYAPTGTGESPLAAVKSWVRTKCPRCNAPARRETNTMPQWAGSCWYFLRFCDPRNRQRFASRKALRYWMPVDLYIGGAEHAVLHLLYARFWCMALHDAGELEFEEPFYALRNQGMILGPDGQKMSKSRGNVINPDEIVGKYGADTLRLYELFLGPFEADKPWNPRAISGIARFLRRVWQLQQRAKEPQKASSTRVKGELAKLVPRIAREIETLKFNTAIAALMSFVNLANAAGITRRELEVFLHLLYPFAPHIAEEMWERLGHRRLLARSRWPRSPQAGREEKPSLTIVVQVNGRVRGHFTVQADSSPKRIIARARKLPRVQKYLAGAEVKRVVVVPRRLINFVTTPAR